MCDVDDTDSFDSCFKTEVGMTEMAGGLKLYSVTGRANTEIGGRVTLVVVGACAASCTP